MATAAEITLNSSDLQKYLERIGSPAVNGATLETLRAVHLAHATSVPFENLDVQMQRPIKLDIASVFAKIVTSRRGGYCFEQNTLLLAALQALGFAVRLRDARVLLDGPVLPRTHCLLSVDLQGKEYLCDVGFGGEGLVYPLDMSQLDQEIEQGVWKFRLVARGAFHLIQFWRFQNCGWVDQMELQPEAVLPIDWEMASFYTSEYPSSIFRRTVLTQMVGLETRRMLRGPSFIEVNKDSEKVTPVTSRQQCLELLRTYFHLELPAETKLCSWPDEQAARSD